jgi:hypothetical protein
MKVLVTLVCTLSMTACLIQPRGGGNYGGGGGGAPASSGDPSGDRAGEPMPASYASGSSAASSAAPAPQGPVSVTIRSACPKTVKVFYGDKPKFGSGTYSSISSNSVQSHSFRQGDMFWIVDDSENGLGSTSIGPGTRELEISASCTSINAR